MWKILGITVLAPCLVIGAFFGWFFSLIDEPANAAELRAQRPDELPYLEHRVQEQRGRILAVVTSETLMGNTGKKTGYELTELARAYYVFTVNGFEVDIASPLGGEPTAIIDDDDMAALDFAFLNDPLAQQKASDTLSIASIEGRDYDALYFVGGKGTMWDFPENKSIQRLVREFAEQGKLIGAVCHGPAALANVTMRDGTPFLNGKAVTGFTNEEELFLLPDAESYFPFLLENRMREQGARVNNGIKYLENTVVSDGLVTGQNPWSVYATAEAMIRELGYEPVAREITGDENSVEVLQRFHSGGRVAAREAIDNFLGTGANLNRNLLLVHGIVSAMQWELKQTLELLVLAQHVKSESVI